MSNVRLLNMSSVKRAFITLLFWAFSLAHPLFAAEASPNPFASIVVRGNAVVATLPAKGRWLVISSAAERTSTPGEVFAIAPGSALTLSERHTTYHFTARLEPEAGLSVYAVFDARSFGGQVTKSHYFIKAAK